MNEVLIHPRQIDKHVSTLSNFGSFFKSCLFTFSFTETLKKVFAKNNFHGIIIFSLFFQVWKELKSTNPSWHLKNALELLEEKVDIYHSGHQNLHKFFGIHLLGKSQRPAW